MRLPRKVARHRSSRSCFSSFRSLDDLGTEGSSYIGGIAGINYYRVTDSHNTGAVSGSYYVGGIVGYNGYNVRNTYNTGAVSGSESVGSVIGHRADGIVVNNYYLAGTAEAAIAFGSDSSTVAIAKTEQEFQNGTVAYLLNQYVGYAIFGQTLTGEGKDASPVFLTDSNRIYYGYTSCDAAQTTPIYSNVSTATAEKPTHEMAAATCTTPSTCTVCGHTEGNALGHAYDNDCDDSCNTCGATRTVGDHYYDNDADTVCNSCGYERATVADTTASAEDAKTKGCKKSIDSTYAVLALIAVLGFAFVAKKKEEA